MSGSEDTERTRSDTRTDRQTDKIIPIKKRIIWGGWMGHNNNNFKKSMHRGKRWAGRVVEFQTIIESALNEEGSTTLSERA